MKRPIMLWITSRSRSSMVAAIFIEHGIWWGDTPAMISGYQMNENQNIKALLKQFKIRYWKKVHLTPVSPKWNEEFTTELEKIVPNTTWMMKTGVEYFPAFLNTSPYNVFIKRNPSDVAQSLCDKRPDVNYEEALHVARWRFDYMDKLQQEYGGVFVDTDKIIHQGDFSEIKEAIEYCGIKYDFCGLRRKIKNTLCMRETCNGHLC